MPSTADIRLIRINTLTNVALTLRHTALIGGIVMTGFTLSKAALIAIVLAGPAQADMTSRSFANGSYSVWIGQLGPA